MEFIEQSIPGVFVIEPKKFGDARGYFMETYRQDLFEQHVGKVDFVQDNESRSSYGVLRGLHFQKGEFSQAKLVRVLEGRVLDSENTSPWNCRPRMHVSFLSRGDLLMDSLF